MKKLLQTIRDLRAIKFCQKRLKTPLKAPMQVSGKEGQITLEIQASHKALKRTAQNATIIAENPHFEDQAAAPKNRKELKRHDGSLVYRKSLKVADLTPEQDKNQA